MKTNTNEKASACKFCKASVDLDSEGVTYRDGSCAHDACHDSSEYESANACDFRD